MEKRVIFRDRQEVQAVDFNNFETFANDSIKHVVADGITSERRFTGFGVTASADTELTINTGRMYQGGDVYTLDTQTIYNMFQYLTVATKRVVALVAFGEVIETDTQPRDFLIDITSGATEPSAVPMQSRKQARLSLVSGVESADPVAPAIGENTVVIAFITMTTTKIDSIQYQYGNIVPNAYDNQSKITDLQSWRSQVSPQVDSIQTQIAALTERSADKADISKFRSLAAQVALLKREISLPAGATDYDADIFTDLSKTDAVATGTSAIVGLGLQFGYAASDTFPMQLFNPLETRVKKTPGGFVLPAYSEVPKLQVSGYNGDIAISQYQTTEKETKQVTVGGSYWVYGSARTVIGNVIDSSSLAGYGWGAVYDYTPGYMAYSSSSYYEETDVTVTYNGAMLAQTFLAPNSFWLTSIDIFLVDVASTGDVTVGIAETILGQPNLEKTIAVATISAASLKKYPAKTNVPLPPSFVEAGKRYSAFIITPGAHRVATVSSNNYTQGTLFFSTDEAWFQGDLTKDLMFNLNGASFDQARIEVNLGNVSLAGGITDIEMKTQALIPSGTELSFEVQVAGLWYKIRQGDVLWSAKPDLIPMRMVFVGTSDVMPGIQFGPGKIVVSRPATILTHLSALRTLSTPSDDITVTLDMLRFDPATETLTCVLTDNAGANPLSPSLTQISVATDPNGTPVTTKTFTFTPGSPRSSYKIKFAGTRTAPAYPFTGTQRTDVAL